MYLSWVLYPLVADLDAVNAEAAKAIAAFNNHDLATMVKTFTEDCILISPCNPAFKGRAGEMRP